ncbi:DUF6119 family protein [Kribbella sp. NPDC051952]|uniref:DUF6119 family protein n=1 Tax=Kribbella sp. NPDC051952 TaxID=3154851 RepID=UPI00341D9387
MSVGGPMRLNMYLLRKDAKGDNSVIRTKAKVKTLTSRTNDLNIAKIFLIEGDSKPPKWLADLDQVAMAHAGDKKYSSLSLGAVILVSAADRLVAVTFGTGFHVLEPSFVERGFGLKVTANIIAADKIKSVQTRGIASNSRDQYTMLPVDGEFSDLNVEVDEEWLRQLSGKATDKGFATTVAGADSLRIAVPDFPLTQITSKVESVLAVYAKDDYKKNFAFLDQITPLDKKDPLIEKLDDEVVKLLRSGSDKLAFSAPDPFDQANLDHYELACGRQGRFVLGSLDSEPVMSVVAGLHSNKNPLTDIDIYALTEDDKPVDRVHPLKSYVMAEISNGGSDYLLSAGLWFEIQKEFRKEVNAKIASIEDITDELALPVWDVSALDDDPSDDTIEGSYNKMVSDKKAYGLLDKDLVYFAQYEKLEICDLLTPKAELLCVKAASNSPSLSHLVAQAINSAKAWGDEKYQSKLSDVWETIRPGDPIPDRGDVTFVLAIATDKSGPLSKSLFFFTKVQIAYCLKEISRSSFGVALARINVKPGVVIKKKRKSTKENSPAGE